MKISRGWRAIPLCAAAIGSLACGPATTPEPADASAGDTAPLDASAFLSCGAGTALTWLGDGSLAANDPRFTLARVRTTGGPLSEYAAGHLFPSQSLYFDGTSYLSTADTSNSYFDQLESAMSVEAWIQIPLGTAPSAVNASILDKTTGSGSSATGFSLSLDAARVRFSVGPARWLSDPVPIAASPATLGRWVHVIGTYLDHTPRVFIDGEMSGSLEVTSHTNVLSNDAPLRIGGDQAGNSRFFGRIDNIRIYCTVLSANEIRDRFNSTDPR